ncbi:hypothetical protein [Burkholderia anthina]|uniref:Uncharacterized protein n=1 Tax=Burkholderia anthina TaxID=179879 RepID=A0A6P2GBI5_9BURK|nr:hypothetical protein [Burkholderia anthina]VVU50471.1 hypothetical protein BAN20980_03187 [Burkholderia anthina]
MNARNEAPDHWPAHVDGFARRPQTAAANSDDCASRLLRLDSDLDREILSDALAALLRERICALHLAERVALATNRPRPDPGDYGLTDILRLSRQLENGSARHRDAR